MRMGDNKVDNEGQRKTRRDEYEGNTDEYEDNKDEKDQDENKG